MSMLLRVNNNEEANGKESCSIHCVKCSNASGNFFRLENTQSAGYCRQCFGRVIRHKFAYCLGKNRVFKDDNQREALLVYYPDDMASLQLLRLTQEAMAEPNMHKRLRLNVKVLFLSSASSTDQLAREVDRCKEQLSSRYPVEWIWHFFHEASIITTKSNIPNCSLGSEKHLLDYNSLLASCSSDSVRVEMKRLLRTKLICRLSALFHCSTVLLPDNAEKLAQDVLNAVCFGRSSSLLEMSAMVDARFVPVQFVRPLRDISDRELKAMSQLEETTIAHSEETNNDNKVIQHGEGLQLLTSQLIDSLRNNGFPSTVSTILSVASKLESDRSGQKCSFCCTLNQFDSHDESLLTKANGIEIDSNRKELCPPCARLLSDIDAKWNYLFAEQVMED